MIVDVLNKLKAFFGEYIKPIYKVTKIQPTNNGWEALVEVIEEKEYMKFHAKDEMIGVYQVSLNGNLEIISFSRVSMRPRSDMIEDD